MRFTLFLSSWGLVGLLTFGYLLSGSIVDARVKRNRARREKVLEIIGIVLFETDAEAAALHDQVLTLPRGPLLAVLQSLAVDLDGNASLRLHQLVRSTGLELFIRRRARSRRWRMRVQAAQLQHLVTHPDFDRAALLDDRSTFVRARAAETLTSEQAAQHLDRLLELLGDKSTAVRLAAQHGILNAGAQAVPRLLEHLEGDDDKAISLALDVAANLPDPRLVEILNEHAKAEDRLTMATAARVMGNGAGVITVALLEGMLDDHEPSVRVAAIDALARLGSMSSTIVIGKRLADRSFDVRRAAGYALDDLGASGRLVLRQHLDDPDRFGRDMARQILDAAAARSGLSTVPPPEDPLSDLNEPDPYGTVASAEEIFEETRALLGLPGSLVS
ncbi:MAG: hypothetical protein ACI8TP_003210 [Acidimicrobiales bacterium]|jgi:hypothetical protein